MLFLLFQLGNDRYVLEASRVVEVVPLLALKQLPQAPEGVAEFRTQACSGERATRLSVPDALALAQGATLVRARLIFEGDVTTPWFTPDGAVAPT